MTNLYIDPGFAALGWAVFENKKLKDFGQVRTYPRYGHVKRLERITLTIMDIVEKYDVDAIFYERYVVRGNRKSTLGANTLQAIGAIIGASIMLSSKTFKPIKIKGISYSHWSAIAKRNAITVPEMREHERDAVMMGVAIERFENDK